MTDPTTGGSRGNADPLAILSSAAAIVALGTDLDATLAGLLGAATEAVGASFGVVYLQDPDRSELQVAVTTGLDEAARTALEAAAGDPGDAPAIVARDRNAASAGAGAFLKATEPPRTCAR